MHLSQYEFVAHYLGEGVTNQLTVGRSSRMNYCLVEKYYMCKWDFDDRTSRLIYLMKTPHKKKIDLFLIFYPSQFS